MFFTVTHSAFRLRLERSSRPGLSYWIAPRTTAERLWCRAGAWRPQRQAVRRWRRAPQTGDGNGDTRDVTGHRTPSEGTHETGAGMRKSGRFDRTPTQ